MYCLKFCVVMKLRLRIVLFLLTISVGIKAQRSDALDDALRLVPLATTYTLKASGVEGASSWKRLGVNTMASLVICYGTTQALKHTISKDRPDGSDNRSFPSGHSSIAFAAAHQLHKEYGKVSPWISVGGYAVAVFTAVDRVRRDRHDWLDVTAGAATGIASTELGYWIGDKITGEKSRYQISVAPNGLAVVVKL